jgi:hypothetical protein
MKIPHFAAEVLDRVIDPNLVGLQEPIELVTAGDTEKTAKLPRNPPSPRYYRSTKGKKRIR